ncbi:hypothetical protein FBU30_004303 [Linnemannia zychae]|nr:hypothetical protein FBU30_004303 [Linnemannia zychae]
MTGPFPPSHNNEQGTEPFRNVASTATATAMPSMPTATTTATAATSIPSGAVALEIGGYKVHPSALASNAMAGSSSNTFTTTAGQLAATLAANDSLRNGHNEINRNNQNGNIASHIRADNSSDSGFFSDLVVRLLPIALGSLVGYIVYVYNFRLCIDYLLRFLDNPIQAGIYMGVFNLFALLFYISYIRTIFNNPGTPLKASGLFRLPPKRNPPPPIPPTTTPYQTQQTVKGDSLNSSRANTGQAPQHPISDTTPLLQSTRTGDQSTLFSRYQAMKQIASLSSTDTDHKTRSVISQNSGLGASSSNGQPQGQLQDIEATSEAPVATLSISKKDGSPRWCDLCHIAKPDRCHHCKECNQCVLRMDHHCPWVNSCIGYNNLKFFYLFILYGSLLSIWVICTTIPIIVSAYHQCEQDSLMTWTIRLKSLYQRSDCMFDLQWIVITVLSFFLMMFVLPLTAAHTVYIVNNRTTIESLQDARNMFIRVQYKNTTPPPLYPPGAMPPQFNVVLVQPVPYANTTGDGIHEVYSDQAYDRLVTAPQTGYGQPLLRPLGNRGYGSGRAADAVSSQSTLIPRSSYGVHPMATKSLAVPSSSGWGKSRSSEDSSDSSIGSLGRSLPTPHSSPRMEPQE